MKQVIHLEPGEDAEQNRRDVETAMRYLYARGGGEVVLEAGVWLWPEQPLVWLNGVVLRGHKEDPPS